MTKVDNEKNSGQQIIDLYTWSTPNGRKVSIMLEEIGLPYEAHKITLADADVKSPEFLSLNPNNKIPAIIDPDGPDGDPIGLFESGAMDDVKTRAVGQFTPESVESSSN